MPCGCGRVRIPQWAAPRSAVRRGPCPCLALQVEALERAVAREARDQRRDPRVPKARVPNAERPKAAVQAQHGRKGRCGLGRAGVAACVELAQGRVACEKDHFLRPRRRNTGRIFNSCIPSSALHSLVASSWSNLRKRRMWSDEKAGSDNLATRSSTPFGFPHAMPFITRQWLCYAEIAGENAPWTRAAFL